MVNIGDPGSGSFLLPDLDDDVGGAPAPKRSRHGKRKGNNYKFYTVAPGGGRAAGLYASTDWIYRCPNLSGNDISTMAKGMTHATKGHDDRDSAVAFLRNLVTKYRQLRRDNPGSDDPLFGHK